MKYNLSKAAILLLLVSIALASCSPKTAAPSAIPTEPPTPVPSTSPAEASAPSEAPAPTEPAVCRVATSAIPAASPEELASVASVPPVSDTDLARGPADAAVTIIEYSDYQ